MEIYIVMADDNEYFNAEYYPKAAFTKRNIAQNFINVDTRYCGVDQIEVCDIEATDKLWVVTSEEAYGSGSRYFREAFTSEEEAGAYAKEINDDVNHVYTSLYNAEVDMVCIDKDIDKLKEKCDKLCLKWEE